MKKKLISLMMIFCFIIASTTTVHAASTATVDLKPSSSKVKQGDTFTVTLSATCDDGINGIDTKYTYDTNNLELVSAQVADTTKWSSLGVDKDITIICNSTDKITNADIYVLTFKVKSDATVGSEPTVSTETITLDSDAATDSTVTIEAKSTSVEVVSKSQPTPTDPTTPTDPANPTDPTTPTTPTDPSTPATPTTPGNGSSSGNKNGSTNGSKTTTGSSTPAKSMDTSTSTKSLPKTGDYVVTGIITTSLLAIIILAVILFRNMRKYDGIE